MAQDQQYTPAQRTQLEKTASYFQRNLPYMAYDRSVRLKNWPNSKFVKVLQIIMFSGVKLKNEFIQKKAEFQPQTP